ncbi:MAG TPA: NADH-quinone oxidoreductase subunit A [Thermoguttaceae bacterium]|nr:NADH-quinone oxidoreductase subunit A [Thermoguttaceae bacterium]
MFTSFWPIFLFFLFLLAVGGVFIGIGYVWNPRRPNPVKAMPYESGMDPFHDARRRLDVRFYLLAVAFLVFDVEVLLLYPWAVAAGVGRQTILFSSSPRTQAAPSAFSSTQGEAGQRVEPKSTSVSEESPQPPPVGMDGAVSAGMIESRRLVLAGALVFIGLLAVGYLYDWRKGILRWR